VDLAPKRVDSAAGSGQPGPPAGTASSLAAIDNRPCTLRKTVGMNEERPASYLGALDERIDPSDLLNQAGDVIYCLDLEGRFTYCNRAGLDVFQIPLECSQDWFGRSFGDLLTAESRQIALEHFQRGVEGKEKTPFFEVEGVRLDGTAVQLEIRSSSIRRNGELIGRQGVARDITELKDLQAEVQEKSKRLELLESQSRVAMDIYHRLAQLTLDAPGDPLATDGALHRVSEVLSETAAGQLGLGLRDIEIIDLLAEGSSNQEIANIVHLSPNTIKDRVSKIMRALGVKTRTEVVAEASRRGLISLTTPKRPR
jgi:PAS domain S-box-containing protein